MSQGYQNISLTVACVARPSGIAIAGFVFDILGWLTCGALCLIGVQLRRRIRSVHHCRAILEQQRRTITTEIIRKLRGWRKGLR